MRHPSIALFILATSTGCVTTGKTAAQRAAEVARYREQKAAEEEARRNGAAPQAPPPPPSETTPTAEATPASEAGAATPAPPAPPAVVTPEAPALPLGPRKGVYGIRASLLGSALALDQSAGSSALGLRYFSSEAVSINTEIGLVYAFLGDDFTSLTTLGVGLDIYFGGTPGKALRPFFALKGSFLSQVGTASAMKNLVSFGAGSGLEYWFSPQLSVNTTLMISLSKELGTDGFVIGTFQPGLGVTLYTE